MAGKGLILSGKGGSWIATASCDVATAGGSGEGGKEGAVRWLVRGSQGLVGMFAWRECERESLLVHELPGWPGSLSPALGSLSDEDGPLC